MLGYRPQRVCALAFHLSFLYFSRQIAENKFQLKSTILCDIALSFYTIFFIHYNTFQEKNLSKMRKTFIKGLLFFAEAVIMEIETYWRKFL